MICVYFDLMLTWKQNKQKNKLTSDSESKKPGMSLELVKL